MKTPSYEVVTPGLQFKKWTVIGSPFRDGRYWRVRCRCECGTEKNCLTSALVNGQTTKCKDRCNVAPKHGAHCGGKATPEWITWASMKSRCRNPNAHNYAIYGGRGIKVCSEWADSFEAFLEAVGRKPSLEHSLDRIDVNGHYEPGNVRWATAKEQGNNTRYNRRFEIEGKIFTATEISELTGIELNTFLKRMNSGWDLAQAMTEPVRPRQKGTRKRIRR